MTVTAKLSDLTSNITKTILPFSATNPFDVQSFLPVYTEFQVEVSMRGFLFYSVPSLIMKEVSLREHCVVIMRC